MSSNVPVRAHPSLGQISLFRTDIPLWDRHPCAFPSPRESAQGVGDERGDVLHCGLIESPSKQGLVMLHSEQHLRHKETSLSSLNQSQHRVPADGPCGRGLLWIKVASGRVSKHRAWYKRKALPHGCLQSSCHLLVVTPLHPVSSAEACCKAGRERIALIFQLPQFYV